MPKNLRRIVIDSSALISLTHGRLLEHALREFEIATSNRVLQELEQTAKFADPDGQAAQAFLAKRALLKIIDVSEADFRNYLGRKVHAGEASGLCLAHQQEADAFICDDFDALPYLEVHFWELGIDIGLCSVFIQVLILRASSLRRKGGQFLIGSQESEAGWDDRCMSMERNCYEL